MKGKRKGRFTSVGKVITASPSAKSQAVRASAVSCVLPSRHRQLPIACDEPMMQNQKDEVL
jgi:hypothetical protein